MIYTLTLNPALDKTVVISSFAVDQVNRVLQMRIDPGGKGINVSKVIESLGGRSHAFAALGGASGKELRGLLENHDFFTEVIQAEGKTRTNIKIVDPLLHTNTDINEPGPGIRQETLDALRLRLQKLLKPQDILVLSGSVPAGTNPDIYGQLTALCRTCRAKAFVDAEGILMRQALKERPFLVKPNLKELSEYVGRELADRGEVCEASEQLLAEGAGAVVLSMGSDGAAMFWRDEAGSRRRIIARAPKVAAISTVGAGDSMVGALAYGTDRNMTLPEAFRLAVAAGSAAVTSSGSQAPDPEMIWKLYERIVVSEF